MLISTQIPGTRYAVLVVTIAYSTLYSIQTIEDQNQFSAAEIVNKYKARSKRAQLCTRPWPSVVGVMSCCHHVLTEVSAFASLSLIWKSG